MLSPRLGKAAVFGWSFAEGIEPELTGMRQECAYDLGEVSEVSGREAIVHWDKESLLAVENTRFNTVLLGEDF